jgi:MFS family permease
MAVGILRHRNVRLLWTGSTISALGSWLLVVAVPVQVFQLTGSTLATGLTFAVEALPGILVGPWAGVLVDRWPYRTTMVIANVLSAAGVAVLLLGTTPARVGFVYGGLLAENLAVVFLRPAARAVLPAVVGHGPDLASANALFVFAGGAVRLVGPLLGTVLLSAGGLGVVVGIDVVSYLLSAALVAAVTLSPTPDRDPAALPHGWRQFPRQFRDGVRYLAGSPLLRGLLVVSWGYLTANAALGVLLVPFLVRRLDDPGQDAGYLLAGLGVGYLLGSAASRRLVLRYSARALIVAAYAAVGLCFLALFNAPTLAVATVAAAVAGVPGAVTLVVTQHRVQVGTPAALLGRVGAVFYTSDAVTGVAGALVAPALTALAGLPATLNLLSASVLVAAAGAAVLVPPGIGVPEVSGSRPDA